MEVLNNKNINDNKINNEIQQNSQKKDEISELIKNQKYLFNKSFMVIILDCFNDEFIYYEHKEVRKKKFINIIYKSPTIFLNGLTFETPWMKTIKDCYPIINNDTKYWLEQTFIGNEDDSEINLFLQVMNNIDKNVINYLDSYKNYLELDKYNNNFYDKINNNKNNEDNEKNIDNKNLESKNQDENQDNNRDKNQVNTQELIENLFCKNIKINMENESKYSYLKNKIDIYLKNIVVNNEKYIGNISELKLKNSIIKTTITCSGLWKYNNKCGMSWKVIKMNVILNENDKVTPVNNNSNLMKKIPNFELESDPEYINKINKIR